MERNPYKISTIAESVAKDIFERKDKPDLPTGIASLDEIIWGLKRKELTIIAGRTSHFKTALMIQIAWNLADIGKKIAIFSMEMSKEAVIERVISNHCEVISEDLERNNLTPEKKATITAFVDRLNGMSMDFYVHDDQGFKFDDVGQYCKKYQPDVVFIDYVQMIHSSGASDRETYGEYCRQLKVFSKAYNVAVVVGSQANRAAVEGKEKPQAPRMENIKGSGVLEENPDVVLLVHYAYKYDTEAKRSEFEIVIAKKRNGRTGNVKTQIIPEYYKIF